MTRKMILLFSHKLNEKQIQIAQNEYKVEQFIYLPPKLQSIWSNIDPDQKQLQNNLQPIKEYITKILQKGDIVLVQGDFGATYIMVDFVIKHKAKAVYATTQRVVKESIGLQDETIKESVFDFRRFREYGV